MARPQKRSHRMLDFLIYIAIGTLLAGLAIALGIHQAKTGQRAIGHLKWIGFAIMTLLVFWWTIRAYKPFWTNARLWKLLVLFAVMHLALGVGLLWSITMLSLFPFMVITPLECFLASAFISHFLLQKKQVSY